MSSDILAYGILAVALIALIITYGKIRYTEGRKNGYIAGSLKSTAQVLSFLQEQNVIGLTKTGDIYRIDDSGNRGKIVFDAVGALQQIGSSINLLEDKLQKELDTH